MNSSLYNILIIDNEPDLQDQLIERLKMDGSFAIEITTSAQSALEFMQSTKKEIHLILLDLNLGESWGLDLIPDIKKHTNSPILVISIYASDANKADALGSSSGCIDFITRDEKFSPELTLKKIKNILHEIRKKTTQYVFNFQDGAAYLNNSKLALGLEHVSILEALYESANTPLTREYLLKYCKQTRWQDKGVERKHRANAGLKIVAGYVNKIQNEIKRICPTYHPISAVRATSSSNGPSYVFTN